MENQADQDELHSLIEKHAQFTESTVAATILEDWDSAVSNFKKIIPTLYRKILEQNSAEAVQR